MVSSNTFVFLLVVNLSILVIMIFLFLSRGHSALHKESFAGRTPANDGDMSLWFHEEFGRDIDPIASEYYRRLDADTSKKQFRDYASRVKRAMERAKNETIVIAGLVRNSETTIDPMRRMLAPLLAGFRDYRIVIVENNSVDDTRDLLLDWASEDTNVVILCQHGTVNTRRCDLVNTNYFNHVSNSSHAASVERIRPMKMLRNMYLDYIRSHLSSFTYTLVIDFDLHGEFVQDGFWHSVGLMQDYRDIDFIACAGILDEPLRTPIYYDTFALVPLENRLYFQDMAEKALHDERYNREIYLRLMESLYEPIPVRSAFGGMCLYRTRRMIEKMYNIHPSNPSCEHAYLHDGLNGYINPTMIFWLTKY
jgi:hypothetical protein